MSYNVYADIGYPNADLMFQKAGLVLAMDRAIEARKLKLGRAAKIVGLPVDRLNAILRGDFEDIDPSKLVDCLYRLGHDVHVDIKPLDAGTKAPGKFEVVTPASPRLSA